MEPQMIMMENGQPFNKKGALSMVLQKKGLEETYEAAEYEGGGWVGVPKKAKTSDKAKDNGLSTRKVRIYRSNVDPDNKDAQISVCANNPKDRKIFFPGQEVDLTPTEIGILRDAVEETQIFIPSNSGIYEAKDPEAVARNQWPGMQPKRDPITNLIVMIKRVPKYIIEYVE